MILTQNQPDMEIVFSALADFLGIFWDGQHKRKFIKEQEKAL